MDELRFDIEIEAGSEYPLDVIYSDDDDIPVNMTGWTIEAEIKETSEDPEGYPFATWADANGYHLYLSGDRTAELTFPRGYWDMFITDPERRTRTKLLSGTVKILGDSTRNLR